MNSRGHNTSSLSRIKVASHLQQYRSELKRLAKEQKMKMAALTYPARRIMNPVLDMRSLHVPALPLEATQFVSESKETISPSALSHQNNLSSSLTSIDSSWFDQDMSQIPLSSEPQQQLRPPSQPPPPQLLDQSTSLSQSTAGEQAVEKHWTRQLPSHIPANFCPTCGKSLH